MPNILYSVARKPEITRRGVRATRRAATQLRETMRSSAPRTLPRSRHTMPLSPRLLLAAVRHFTMSWRTPRRAVNARGRARCAVAPAHCPRPMLPVAVTQDARCPACYARLICFADHAAMMMFECRCPCYARRRCRRHAFDITPADLTRCRH